jgi:hypothetical protein
LPTLSELRFARYRSFRDVQRMDLGPITLVFGPNSSGKSAAVRLVPWLAASMANSRPGLDLDAPALLGAGWDHVRWRGGLPSGEEPLLTLGASLSDGTSIDWTLDWYESFAESIVRRVAVRTALGSSATMEWAAQRSERDGPRTYRCGAEERRVSMRGLHPTDGAPQEAREAGNQIATILQSARWLGAVREGPSRGGLPRGTRLRLGPEGRGREAFLLADTELRNRVDAWYREAAEVTIIREQAGDNERLAIQPTHTAGWSVPFSDLGTGLQQVFPIVVDLEMIRARGGILVIEEPEAHLHPSLERRLAHLCVDVVRSQPRAQVLVETHSEVLLLEVLLALTEQDNLARLHWTELRKDGSSSIEPIPVTDGVLGSDRLMRAFETMGSQRRKLLEARRLRAG